MTGSTHTGYWNEIARASATARQALWRQHADAVNAELVARWWPAVPVGRVLKTDLFDEVCGTGLLPDLERRAGRALGLDAAVEAVRLARARLPSAPLVAADVRKLPYRSGVFDLVVSNSTLDHFPARRDIVTSLREIHRVLAPAGRLILTLDNPVNPAVCLRNALPFSWLNRAGLVPYYVGATCGPRQGRRLLTGAGFTVLQTTAILHCPRAPTIAWISRLKRRSEARPRPAVARWLQAWERLERWPTRYLSGYFVGWMAEKRA